jgi:hypothetical protein
MQLEQQGHRWPITVQDHRSSRRCRGLRPLVAILGAGLIAFWAGFIPAASAMPRLNKHGAVAYLLLMVGANPQRGLEPAATIGAKAEVTDPAVTDGSRTHSATDEEAAQADLGVQNGAQPDPVIEGSAQEGQASSLTVGEAANPRSSEKSLLSVEAQKDLIDVIKPPSNK